MSIRVRQGLALAVVATALLWPLVGDRIQAAVTPDRDGCPHSSDLPSERNRAAARAAILCLLNRHRAEHGLPPLAEDPALEAAAQAHAEDMGRRRFFAHEDPDGVGPHERIERAGFRGSTTGENIAWGTRINATPTRIVDGWMASPGHRANILRREFTRVGTGIAYEPPIRPTPKPVGVYVNAFGG
jgi:uncharacterized protein YkwD